LKRPVSETI